MDISSQIEAAVVLGKDGGVTASSSQDEAASATLAGAALELVAAAFELGAKLEVTRVEVELEEGALFVVCEGGSTIAARTGPDPSSGLVVYDLRTCVRSISVKEPSKKKASSGEKKEDAS